MQFLLRFRLVLLQRIETPGLAHYAYLVGDAGEAALVDPRRDVDVYLSAARTQQLTIKYVVETHRHEDFVSGALELARASGAKLVGGAHAHFGYADLKLEEGAKLRLGAMELAALATPGHTPESTCYALFIDRGALAFAVFTGDTLFAGGSGRTDLVDPERAAVDAELLYDAVHRKLVPLGPQVLVLPAHGHGSACGGIIAERWPTTLGYEYASNPVFLASRDTFASAQAKTSLARPPYFRTVERANLGGGWPMPELARGLVFLPPGRFLTEAQAAQVIDMRTPEAYAGGHIPGSLSIWAEGLARFAGWVVSAKAPVLLLLHSSEELQEAGLALARLGIDNLRGALMGGFDAWRQSGMPIAYAGTTDAATLAHERQEYDLILDVRETSEIEETGTIPGARHIYVGELPLSLYELAEQLEPEAHIAVTCSGGPRSSLAVSLLLRHGFRQVDNVLGGLSAWKSLGLPTEPWSAAEAEAAE